MLCESCKTRSATRLLTRVVNGEKRLLYRCDVCVAATRGRAARPTLKRPCDQCGEREGQIKLTRLGGRLRAVYYLCEACAGITKPNASAHSG